MPNIKPAALGIFGGVILILLVAGAGYYFELNAKILSLVAPNVPASYQTNGLQTLLSSTGLIKRLVGLQPVPQSEPQVTKYSTGDIGKIDITKQE